MKNEAPFILEWVAHQKALGFDHIWVATNDCADPTVEILRRLQALGHVRQHNTRKWPAGGIQRSALRQALWYPEVTGAEAIFVCDADEFLVVKTGDGSIRHLAETAGEDWEVVSVAWRVFGPAGQQLYRDRRITRQFTLAERDPAGAPARGVYGKSLFRHLDRIRRIGIHGPEAHPELGRDLVRRFAGGLPYRQMGHAIQIAPDYSVAQVNHYALRSFESFLVKRDRGRVNHSEKPMEADYWHRFDHAEVRCDAIRRYDPAVSRWLARFHADAELHRLHVAAVAWHRAKIAELMALPGTRALAAELGFAAVP